MEYLYFFKGMLVGCRIVKMYWFIFQYNLVVGITLYTKQEKTFLGKFRFTDKKCRFNSYSMFYIQL